MGDKSPKNKEKKKKKQNDNQSKKGNTPSTAPVIPSSKPPAKK